MEKQVLSVEQMQELIDMGIDMSKASMCWNYNDENSYQALVINYTHSPYIENEIIPTFTLNDILNMLPKYIDYQIFEVTVYSGEFNVLNFGYHNLKFCQDMNSTLNSAFKLLKWVKENGYIQAIFFFS